MKAAARVGLLMVPPELVADPVAETVQHRFLWWVSKSEREKLTASLA